MSDVHESFVTARTATAVRPSRWHRRMIVRAGRAAGCLVVAAYFVPYLAPIAFGQSSQSGSSTAAAPTAGAAPTQSKTPAEPQMQDQSAPQEQSLGAIARQAKAQKPKTEATKVYTEDKLSGLSNHGVSSVGAGSQGGGSSYGGNSYGNSGANAGSGSLGNNEAYWRGRAQGIRNQVAQLDVQIAGIQAEIKKKGAVTVDPMSGAAAGVIYVEDRNMQIKQIEGQKQKLQEALDALAEEGRKAGADSGWFR